MIGKLQERNQRELFRTRLEDMINPKHDLALPATAIDWNCFEKEFKIYYFGKPSRPGMPIRLMFGCVILKHLYNPGYERLPEFWIRDVYFQYFCGGVFFEHKFPCDPSDFVHFRKRIGEAGMLKFCIQRKRRHTKADKVCIVGHYGSW
ncbi:MAG: transposase [Prevotellaceae bacterium]|nr:transposase [Prevotellaceae bacterium]